MRARQRAAPRLAVAELDEHREAVRLGVEHREARGHGGLAHAAFAHHQKHGRQAARGHAVMAFGVLRAHASGLSAMASITSYIIST